MTAGSFKTELLEPVLARPGDVVGLRVLADRLLEQGEPLGDFLRLSLDREALTPFEPRWDELGWALLALERRHFPAWTRDLWGDLTPRLERRVSAFRGLPSTLECTGPGWHALEPARLAQVPIAAVHFDDRAPGAVKRLMGTGLLSRLSKLVIGGQAVMADVGKLLASPALSGLEHLELPWADGVCLSWLANLAALPRLRTLSLSAGGMPLPVVDVAPLVSLKLPALRELTLSSLPLGEAGAAHLAASTFALEQLTLSRCDLGTTGGVTLLSSSMVSRLKGLLLPHTELSPKGLVALSELKAPDLLQLDVSGQGTLGKRFPSFVESFALPKLRRLVLSNNALREAGAGALASSKAFANVASLELNGCSLKDEGFAALAKAKHLGALRQLDLAGNSATHVGIKAFVKAPFLKSLQSLNLSHNKFQTEGGKALVTAKTLTSLRVLKLGHNWMGSLGMRALMANPSLKALEEVVDGMNNYGPELWRCFLKTGKPGLKVLPPCFDLTEADLVALATSAHTVALDAVSLPFALSPEAVTALTNSPLARQGTAWVSASPRLDPKLMAQLSAGFGSRLVTW